MADTVTTQSATLATIPASTVIETDQLVSGSHVQKIKLMDGTADSTAVIPGDATNGLDVDVTRVQGSVAVTGTFWQATQPISAASLPLPTGAATAANQPALGTAGTPSADVISVQGVGGGTAIPVSGTFYQATQPVSIAATVTVDSELTTADLDTGAGTDTRAVVGLVLAKSGGAANISSTDPLPVTVISGGGGGTQYTEDSAHASGDTGTLFLAKRTDSPAVSSGTDGDYSTVNVDANGRVYVKALSELGTTGGTTYTPSAPIVSAASTNATNIKSSAGLLYGLLVFNLAGAVRYVKFHNTSGTPTAGSGVVLSVLVPANTAGSGVTILFPNGVTFSTGIALTLVTGIANSDASAVGANEMLVNVLFN